MKRSKTLNLAEYVLFRALLGLLRLFPYSWSQAFVCWLFWLVGYVGGIRRELAERQLKMVYPDLDGAQRKELLRSVYRNMGLTASETYLLGEEALFASCSLLGRAKVEKALSYGRGAILATAHFGNWEAARILPRFGIPLSVVVKRQHNPHFDAYNNAIRAHHGVGLIDYRHGLRGILSHLRNNELVAILADQRAPKGGLVLDFLGYPATHWKGVAKLSLRYKVPILPGLALREGKRSLKFCFEDPIYHPELEDVEENYGFILGKVNKVLEDYINRYPEQWFWVHKRWKGTTVQSSE